MAHCRARLVGAALMLTAFFVLSAGPVLGESAMLKRQYVPGRVSYIESRMEVEQDISGLPMPPMKFQSKQLFGLWERIESAGDMTMIELTYDRAARSVEAPMMGAVEFDTDDPEHEEAAPQLGTVLTPMIGMAMTMGVDGDGQVVSFSGMDAINKKISEKAVASMHWEQMKEDFTNERGIETWGREPLLVYANKEVKVGDTWKAQSLVERPMVGMIVTDYLHKVDRIGTEDGRKVVFISVMGVVSKGADLEEVADSKGHGEAVEESNEKGAQTEEAKKAGPEVQITGTLSGTALYDVELGRVVKETGQGNIDLKIPLEKMMPNVPVGEEPKFASFKISIKSTTLILTEEERNAQKAEARKRAEMRRKAEAEAEDEDEEEEEDDD